MNIKRKSIFIDDIDDVVNHINKLAISEEVVNLVEEIREKIRLKRHKGVDKKITKLKELAVSDLDFLEENDCLDLVEGLMDGTL